MTARVIFPPKEAGMADYYDEFAAKQKARNDAEHADFLAYRAAQDRLPENLRDTIDRCPANPSGPVGYAWISARGE